jgi:hypothetical protein
MAAEVCLLEVYPIALFLIGKGAVEVWSPPPPRGGIEISANVI